MKYQLCIFVLIVSGLVTGCKSGFLSGLAKEQQWSENYSLLEGTTCTSPEMIDGNLATVGTAGREITITLTERKPIHRIVIRGTNIEDIIVYEALGGEGNWRRIKKIKNKDQLTVDMRVSGVVTDQLRFRIGGTFDDKRLAGKYDPMYDAYRSQIKRGRPIAQEIELYGFADRSSNP